MRQRTLLLLTMPLLATACQRAPNEQRDGPVAAGPSTSPHAPASPQDPPVIAPPAPVPSTSPASDASVEPATQMKLAVDGEGLRLVDAKTGKTQALPFGLSRAAVLEPLENLRGPAGQGSNPACGGEYANWADGLGLNFRRDKFVGWSLDDRSDGAITTMAGLGTGSGKRALEAYDYKVVRTTLGDEFSAGGLHGLLSSTAANARITNLWAGEVCLAR